MYNPTVIYINRPLAALHSELYALCVIIDSSVPSGTTLRATRSGMIYLNKPLVALHSELYAPCVLVNK